MGTSVGIMYHWFAEINMAPRSTADIEIAFVLEIAYPLVKCGSYLNRILILEYLENVFMEKIVVGFEMMRH